MKKLLRNFLINLVALYSIAYVIPAFTYEGGPKTLLIGALVFMFINILVVPLIKIVLLPINLLTLGIFSWFANVLGFYVLTLILPQFKIMPYLFPGADLGGVIIPSMNLNVLHVAIVASLLIGLIINLFKWIIKD